MLEVDFLNVECDKTTKQNLWSPNRSNVSTSLDFILSLNIFYLPLAVDDTEICPMCIVPLCEEKKKSNVTRHPLASTVLHISYDAQAPPLASTSSGSIIHRCVKKNLIRATTIFLANLSIEVGSTADIF